MDRTKATKARWPNLLTEALKGVTSSTREGRHIPRPNLVTRLLDLTDCATMVEAVQAATKAAPDGCMVELVFRAELKTNARYRTKKQPTAPVAGSKVRGRGRGRGAAGRGTARGEAKPKPVDKPVDKPVVKLTAAQKLAIKLVRESAARTLVGNVRQGAAAKAKAARGGTHVWTGRGSSQGSGRGRGTVRGTGRGQRGGRAASSGRAGRGRAGDGARGGMAAVGGAGKSIQKRGARAGGGAARSRAAIAAGSRGSGRGGRAAAGVAGVAGVAGAAVPAVAPNLSRFTRDLWGSTQLACRNSAGAAESQC